MLGEEGREGGKEGGGGTGERWLPPGIIECVEW